MLSEALLCLTMAIYHEARGEPILGQMAVAEVIINRVKDKRWPSTVCKVVKQKSQFEFYWDGKAETMYNISAKKVAKSIAEAYLEKGALGVVPNSKWFTTVEVNNYWTKNLKVLKVIGRHKFMVE